MCLCESVSCVFFCPAQIWGRRVIVYGSRKEAPISAEADKALPLSRKCMRERERKNKRQIR